MKYSSLQTVFVGTNILLKTTGELHIKYVCYSIIILVLKSFQAMTAVSRNLCTELSVHAVLAASVLVVQTFSVRLPEPKVDREAILPQYCRSKRGVKILIFKCQEMIIFISNVRREKSRLHFFLCSL